MNRVILLGNLTRDPELKNIGTTNVCNFSIAVNRRTKTGQDTTFVDISAFGKTADNIAKYFQKGKPILVEGRLQTDKWVDKTTQQPRTKLKVVAERFEFVGTNIQQAQLDKPAAPQVPTQTNNGPTPEAPATPW